MLVLRMDGNVAILEDILKKIEKQVIQSI
ncbi:hypothetical protein DD776_08420 [Helicobacter pylori]|uniref:Uncharacterized protein n=1 Tax=Helicobacter pylori TaxID=210 RepID=A0A496J3S5_HELPX|nr:hypothetical protein DD776_08420 [Helicobacter pylori]